MNLRAGRDDGAMDGMDVVLISLTVLAMVTYIFFIAPNLASLRQGSSIMNSMTDQLTVSDDVIGYPDVSGMLGDVQVDNPRPDPSSLGAVRATIRFGSMRMSWKTGTGLDLGRATVTITTPAGRETLPRTKDDIVVRPSWKIVSKDSLLPGHDDNGDDLLEPNEVFDIFIYPSEPLPPQTVFTVQVTVPYQNPLTFRRAVPQTVTPVMNLG